MTQGRLRLGTLALANVEDPPRLLQHAVERGIADIDTADVYAGGESERLIGQHLPAGGIRITTKIGAVAGVGDLRPAELRRRVDASLGRLRRDRIDAVLLHFPDPHVPLAESLGAMDELVTEGKIGAFGLSNHAAAAVAEAVKAGHPLAVQTQYNVLFRAVERDLLPLAERAGVDVQAWGALASGWLTDAAVARGRAQVDSARAARRPASFDPDAPGNRRKLEIAQRLAGVADAAGRDLASLALAFAQARASVVIGPTTLDELDRSFVPPLSDDLRAEIDRIVAPGTVVNPDDAA